MDPEKPKEILESGEVTLESVDTNNLRRLFSLQGFAGVVDIAGSYRIIDSSVRGGGMTGFIAVKGKEDIGYVLFQVLASSLHIDYIFVRPEYRRGDKTFLKLLRCAVDFAKVNEIRKIKGDSINPLLSRAISSLRSGDSDEVSVEALDARLSKMGA